MNTFLDFFWLVLVSFLFLSYLLVLFQIVSDLFRDRELSGWWKALWVVVLVVAPLLGSLVYLIVRGRSMTERSIASTTAARDEVEDYIRSVSGASHSPAEEIARADALRGSGAITDDEFARLKAAALVRAT